MSNVDKCPLCGSTNCTIQRSDKYDGDFIRCKDCFTFNLHEGITIKFGYENEDLLIKQRLNAIFNFLLLSPVKNISGSNYYYYFYYDDAGKSENPLHINVTTLLADYPETLLDKIDNILINFSKKFKTYGEMIDRNYLGRGFYYCESDDSESEISSIFKFLIEYGYYNKESSLLTAKAWERIDELRKNKNLSKQAFIAMWFPSDSDKKFAFMQEVRTKLKEAITNAGFYPQIIDEKEHNNQIVPELLHEIKSSRFLVADITEHRNGVYYEAGIMEGLGRQVIVCCQEDDFEKKHFDIAQKNLIKYKNADELYDKLFKRIRATIEGAKQ